MINTINERLLLKDGIIYNPVNDKKEIGDILIEDGKIKDIGKLNFEETIKYIDCKNKIISHGFIDLHSHFREPGNEDKETLRTGANAAFSGGFTRVCIMPNTNPTLDNPESIRFIIDKSKNLPIKIFPIGTITKGQKGIELAEIGEMFLAGIVAISDDGIPLQNGQVMRYAVEYAQKYNIPVINHAEDIYLRNDGVVNESLISTQLGLPGNPDISESVMIHRDLQIAEYSNGKIHIPHVSTAKSVELIRNYKKKGINVTCEVTPHHLALTEDIVSNYNTNAKVAPPLRSNEDRVAIIEGLKDGTIDCISTDHAPHTIEEKEKDFLHTPCGMIGLESAFALVYTTLLNHDINIEQIIKWMTVAPAKIMGWSLDPFKIDSLAEIVIIDPARKWFFSKEHIQSKSKNSPILGMEFNGKVAATICGNKVFSNSSIIS